MWLVVLSDDNVYEPLCRSDIPAFFELLRPVEENVAYTLCDLLLDQTYGPFFKGYMPSLVGVRGLEPPTSASRTLRASRLRYTPA
jgi:hypothetical protein